MSKQEIIARICESASGINEEFLSNFSIEELDSYLEKLLAIDLEIMAQCA